MPQNDIRIDSLSTFSHSRAYAVNAPRWQGLRLSTSFSFMPERETFLP